MQNYPINNKHTLTNYVWSIPFNPNHMCPSLLCHLKMPPAKSHKSYMAAFKSEVKFVEENGGNMAETKCNVVWASADKDSAACFKYCSDTPHCATPALHHFALTEIKYSILNYLKKWNTSSESKVTSLNALPRPKTWPLVLTSLAVNQTAYLSTSPPNQSAHTLSSSCSVRHHIGSWGESLELKSKVLRQVESGVGSTTVGCEFGLWESSVRARTIVKSKETN